jgi:hypothetical protein
MRREEPGDFHPIINEWGGEWVFPKPVEGMSLPGSIDLRAKGKAGRLHVPMLLPMCLCFLPIRKKFPFFLTYCNYSGALKAC